MSKSKKIVVGMIAIVAIAIVGYFVPKDSKQSILSKPIVIGFIGPLTGENAAIGEGIKNAISLSAKNKNVEVIYEDDQFDTKLGITAYHKLRDIDKVDAIINTTPSVINAITPLLKDDPIIIMQIAEPELSADDTIFQIMPSGATLYEKLGEIAKDRYQSFAFVYQNGATFEKAKNHFRDAYEDSNHVFNEYRMDESNDYRTLVTKIKSDNTLAYTVIATPSAGSQFIKQMEEQQIKSTLVCNADIEVTLNEYLKTLSSEVFNGCISSMFVNRMSDSFKTDYKNSFGSDPGFATDYGFDAVTILADTFNKDISSWTNSLKNLSFNGMSGKVQFDNNGVRMPEIEIHTFKDGKFVKQ